MPGFERILCRIPQLPNGRLDPFAQLQVELNRSQTVFIRVHGLPPGSPRFCPHPQWIRFRCKSTTPHCPQLKPDIYPSLATVDDNGPTTPTSTQPPLTRRQAHEQDIASYC